MGLFSFGGSKSKSRSQSSSSSFSFDNLDQFGFNFGQTGSEGGSASSIAFQDIFQNLFSGASATAAGIDTGALTNQANLLFGSGLGFLGGLQDGGAGTAFLQDQLAQSDNLVNTQIDQLGADLGEFLNETILPGIKSSGIQAGTLGGGRGEVSKGLAAEGLLEEFARGSTNIRQAERSRLTGIADSLANQSLARNQAGLAALPALFGLAESGTLSSLSPFAALSTILGGPTVLQDSFSRSFGTDFGIDSTTGRAGSRSSSSSSSSSSSKSFSIGLE